VDVPGTAVVAEAVDVVSDPGEKPSLRPAVPSEALELSQLALRAKGHWGYSGAFLSACRAELTISEDQCEAGLVTVAEYAGRVAGFCAVGPLDVQTVELDAMYVDPPQIGRGVGRALTEHAANWARNKGYRLMSIQADPHAAGFYRKCGARPTGTRPSGSIAGRSLPMFVLDLAPASLGKARGGSQFPGLQHTACQARPRSPVGVRPKLCR
jgi:GNAT superfamily N-acetyltransferase